MEFTCLQTKEKSGGEETGIRAKPVSHWSLSYLYLTHTFAGDPCQGGVILDYFGKTPQDAQALGRLVETVMSQGMVIPTLFVSRGHKV